MKKDQIRVKFSNLGLIDYKEAWDYQENLLDAAVKQKLASQKQSETVTLPVNHLLFCEHPHVYTLGKSGDQNNLLLDLIQLKAKDAAFYKINRGGDITYHGPGQLVGYPVFDLEQFHLGLREYIHLLEESVIKAMEVFGIQAARVEGATGVWLDPDHKERTRKICAIGVRVSRYVTMHGFALNINTNLDYFSYINPCGFTDKGVSSMEKELGAKQDFSKVSGVVAEKMAETFRFEFAG